MFYNLGCNQGDQFDTIEQGKNKVACSSSVEVNIIRKVDCLCYLLHNYGKRKLHVLSCTRALSE